MDYCANRTGSAALIRVLGINVVINENMIARAIRMSFPLTKENVQKKLREECT